MVMEIISLLRARVSHLKERKEIIDLMFVCVFVLFFQYPRVRANGYPKLQTSIVKI